MVLFPVSEDIEVPPTDLCLKLLPLFKFLLFLEIVLVMGSLAAKDFWGALSLYLIVLLGLCCLPAERGTINITRCLYYTVLVIYCGVLNLIQSAIFFKKSEEACCFHETTPTPVKVVQAVRICLPCIELLSACVTWGMFRDCARVVEQMPLLGGEGAAMRQQRGGGLYDAFEGGDQRGRNNVHQLGDRQFHAFQGTGHKLGH